MIHRKESLHSKLSNIPTSKVLFSHLQPTQRSGSRLTTRRARTSLTQQMTFQSQDQRLESSLAKEFSLGSQALTKTAFIGARPLESYLTTSQTSPQLLVPEDRTQVLAISTETTLAQVGQVQVPSCQTSQVREGSLEIPKLIKIMDWLTNCLTCRFTSMDRASEVASVEGLALTWVLGLQ